MQKATEDRHDIRAFATVWRQRAPSSGMACALLKSTRSLVEVARHAQASDDQPQSLTAMQELKKLLIEELQDIYDAENLLIHALPRMAARASQPQLKQAFRRHLEETRGHVQRIEKALGSLKQNPERNPCAGMQGIIDEGEVLAARFKQNRIADVALISVARKVEHYEITAYGSLCAWAQELGAGLVSGLLQQNLAEEKSAEVNLAMLARNTMTPAGQNAVLRRGARPNSLHRVVTG